MRLKELNISGFKSFNKKTLLQFPSSITAIVGPNGSGKSNIVEAFRFVLGEQSTKTLRGKRGEDLIFIGQTKARYGFVQICFDNQDNFFDIQMEEVTVSRKVSRGGTNEYMLNGSIVKLKDIQDLFSSVCIGSRGSHIISQGEADNILRANPQTLQEIVEDSFGLTLFQNKKKESIYKLEKTRESLKESSIIRREISPRLDFLEKQMKAIEEANILRESLRSAYTEYLAYEHSYLIDKEKEIVKQQEKIEVLRKVCREGVGEEYVKSNEHKEEETEQEIEHAMMLLRDERNTLIHSLGVFEGRLARQQSSEDEEKIVVQRSDIVALNIFAKKEYKEIRGETSSEKIIEAFGKIIQQIDILLKSQHTHKNNEKEIKNIKIEYEVLKKQEKEIVQREETLLKQQRVLRTTRVAKQEKIKSVFLASTEKKQSLVLLESECQHEQKIYTIDMEEYKKECREARALLGDIPEYKQTHEKTNRNKQRDKRKNLERLKIRLEETNISGGGEIVKEYQDVKERDDFLERETVDISKSIESLVQAINRLEKDIERQFQNGCKKVNKTFDMFFKQLFGTGTASLSTTSCKGDEKKSGVKISVYLPHKKVTGLDQLSGGERSLISIAFLFALSQVTPPPFLVLDETDAALDEANSRRYSAMLCLLSKQSQLIVVTHNRETMSVADVLYGITMNVTGESKLLSIVLEEAVRVAK